MPANIDSESDVSDSPSTIQSSHERLVKYRKTRDPASLPPEIFHRILQFATCTGAELSNCCRVSYAWRAAADRQLYFQYSYGNSSRKPVNLARFLYGVADKDRGDQVRELSLNSVGKHLIHRYDVERHKDHFNSLAEEAGLDCWNFRRNRVTQCYDARLLIPLILTRTRNVQEASLDLQEDFAYLSDLLHAAVSLRNQSPFKAFQHLRKLRLVSHRGDFYPSVALFWVKDVGHVFHLPALEDLTIDGIGAFMAGRLLCNRKGQSPIRELSITIGMWPETTVTRWDIATILQQPRMLKRLNVYFSQIRMPHEDFVDGLWNGLLQHRDTLESLVIETGFPEWTDWLSFEKPEAYHPCAPLGEFPGLKELAVSENCLHCETPCWHEDTGTWTTAAFPPNLKTLTIMDCFHADAEELDFDSVLAQFVDEGKGCLKQIEVTTRRFYEPFDFNQTESACLDKGVRFEQRIYGPGGSQVSKVSDPTSLAADTQQSSQLPVEA
ncbi:hypothetical protein BP00DRAFT_146435 [Aspergillus indologenus CBS 114.80]|uniref:F-box domain-containing protein n=1 Tax=Aspergillus indologenus CBS 114.80 TaxID=1450541 RepID=A0A2V5IVI2_9EURO|nr:hypothetical protein BP00DRAFT_146435 [Aspergillus indologenus CBS 114.80]